MGEPGTKEILNLEDLEASGGIRTGRKHVLSILVENKPGVLARIAGLFARRGFNIDSLAVGATDDTSISRITLTVDGAAHPIDQVSKRSVTVEVTGTDDKIEAFEQMVRPFGLIEMVRTGEIAVARGRGAT